MKFIEICHSVIIYFAALLSPSPSSEGFSPQHPLEFTAPEVAFPPDYGNSGPPKFRAPNGPDSARPFVCKYPALGKDWIDCSTTKNRGCWLRKKDGAEFNIQTDYEEFYPPGIVREVSRLLPVSVSDCSPKSSIGLK
jgi:hypothetical protein